MTEYSDKSFCLSKKSNWKLQVEWDGERVHPDSFYYASDKSGVWEIKMATVFGTGSPVRLSFGESSEPGASNGSGPWVDEIVLVKVVNPCEGAKIDFPNVQCIIDQIEQVGEQSGTNVTVGYVGSLETDAVPITIPFDQTDLCPVNVHWHLGAEHLSVGEYDETGSGPSDVNEQRRLAGGSRLGFQCTSYDEGDPKFTTPYQWEHCLNMEVG